LYPLTRRKKPTEKAQESLQVLLAAGRPLEEPVVFGGPFVMNTRDELQAAAARYERGEMGRLSLVLSQ
jgi:quercetin 2,3-dioxygenase